MATAAPAAAMPQPDPALVDRPLVVGTRDHDADGDERGIGQRGYGMSSWMHEVGKQYVIVQLAKRPDPRWRRPAKEVQLRIGTQRFREGPRDQARWEPIFDTDGNEPPKSSRVSRSIPVSVRCLRALTPIPVSATLCQSSTCNRGRHRRPSASRG